MTDEHDLNRRSNQTELHQRLGEMALIWIRNRATLYGIHGTVEVPYGFDIDEQTCSGRPTPKREQNNFIADAMAVGRMQMRFYDQYIGRKNRADYPHFRHVFQFESKVSVQDFKNIHKVKPYGSMNWIVTPKGMISVADVPEPWGLLEQSGNGLREVLKPKWVGQPREHFLNVCETLIFNSQFRQKRMEINQCPDCGKEITENNNDRPGRSE